MSTVDQLKLLIDQYSESGHLSSEEVDDFITKASLLITQYENILAEQIELESTLKSHLSKYVENKDDQSLFLIEDQEDEEDEDLYEYDQDYRNS